MNAPTLFLYAFVLADDKRTKRFLERWTEAGVAGIRALLIKIIASSINQENDVQKAQFRLIEHAMSQVSYLHLGYSVQAHVKGENRAHEIPA